MSAEDLRSIMFLVNLGAPKEEYATLPFIAFALNVGYMDIDSFRYTMICLGVYGEAIAGKQGPTFLLSSLQ